MSLCGEIPIQSARAHGFGGKAGFILNTGHVFPESMMVAITLGGGVAQDGGARARAGYELLSDPLLSSPFQGQGQDSNSWSTSPRGQSEWGLFPLSMYPIHLSQWEQW